MTALRHALAAFTALVLFAVPVSAQKGNRPSLSVTPDVLQAGSSTTVTYSNPSMAGQTVVIEVDNGMRGGGETMSIEIDLDENGVGRKNWNVPLWWGANFNAPGVAEVHAPIMR